MAPVRRTPLILAAAVLTAVLGPAGIAVADSFRVVKAGGPPARLLVLGLGDSERACGSADLPAGPVVLRFAADEAGCAAIAQFVVIVRANSSDGDSFLGEWCEAIVASGGTLRLVPGPGDPGAAPMACVLSAPSAD